MKNQDNLGVVLRYSADKEVGVTFKQFIDAVGETIIAEVYYLSTGAFLLTVNASGTSTVGGSKGDEVTVMCDFRSVPVGDGYSIVFRTAANGVLAKAPLVIFGADGFSTEELSGELPDTDPVVVESDDVDLVLTLPGTYIYTGAVDANWTLPALDDHQEDEYHIKNRSSNGAAILTVTADGTDEIFDSSAVSSVEIFAGETIKTFLGYTYWEI